MEPTTPQPDNEQHITSHTYEDDLAQAMNATEATEVQILLAKGREKEEEAALEVVEGREQKWYSTSSIILIVLTLGILAYGAYYYMHLTVPVQPAVSVGVFQNTANIVAGDTTVDQLLSTLVASTTLPVGKPMLVNLVTDTQTNALLSNSQLYSFIGASVTEPLQATISSARLGVVNTGTTIVPFIVASVPNPEQASNELSIAEPTLLELFSRGLSIDTAGIPQEPAIAFQSQYFYNLPVRTLTAPDPATGQPKLVFLYGYATNNILVLTSKPEALKAVYDTVISQ